MSDTPRTDNAAGDGTTVPADFAADLERELAAMTERAEKADVVVDNSYIEIKRMRAEVIKVEDQRDEARADIDRINLAVHNAGVRIDIPLHEGVGVLARERDEARAELARLKEAIPAVLTHIDDIGARGYYSGKTLEEDAAIEALRTILKETK